MSFGTLRNHLKTTFMVGLIGALAVVISTAACSPQQRSAASSPDRKSSAAEVLGPEQVAPLVEGIVHKTIKDLKAKRLASGLVPPTNRWFSGLVFGDEPQPVFPLPLSFGLTDSGFAFGQPAVTTSERNISGGFRPDIAVDVGATDARVSAYDTLTVTLDSLDGAGEVLGQTRIAQGWPFVSYTAVQPGKIGSALHFGKTGDLWTTTAGDVRYGLVVNDGSVSGGTIELNEGGTAIWFVVPADGSAEELAELAANPLTGSTLDYSIDGDQVRTKLTYHADGDTAFATMPHQQQSTGSGTSCDLGTYPSSYGTLKLCAGAELSWNSPVSEPKASLDLGSLSTEQREQLTAQVTKDAAQLPAFPADTYFGGKALYRAAMLYELAVQLKAERPAEDLKAKLTETLSQWTDLQGCAKRQAFCFVYDERAKGVVGMTPSFGSEEFNDHHFHYGYFLYAAGVLATHDPGLAKQYAPAMNLLAADIGSSADVGSGSTSEQAHFPDRRTFDAYAGHSWASGTSPFADGNNQESSSEAVTAWTGLALWGKASGNANLIAEATWMVSSEAQSGLAYWTNFDTSQSIYSGYGHKIVALNWGGKRDYATWFSPEPAAMLGILVIPMSPSSTYLAGDPARIEANVAEATGGRFDQKFGDYLLMYSALAGEQQRQAALATAEELEDKWIDDGNSRSYLLAWLMSLKTS
jgi:endo-1,3(4)-beta-glucanase